MIEFAQFAAGLLRPELFMGVTSGVTASHVQMTLSAAGAPSASHFEARRYGRGEVGEFVLIEGQLNLVLARLIEIKLPDGERRALLSEKGLTGKPDIIGLMQLLGTVQFDTLRVAPGVANHPRIGDRIYAAPHSFVGLIPQLQESVSDALSPITLNLGTVRGASDAPVEVRPEKLFGRHCAVLGATGGGKSWTVTRLLEEVSKHSAKVVLLDATSEYRTLPDATTTHVHLGNPVRLAPTSAECSLPPSGFQETDFAALFEPAGKVQGPKLREAIRSLRIVQLEPALFHDGAIKKANMLRKDVGLSCKLARW